MKKAFIILLTGIFVASACSPASYAYTMAPEFLCESGAQLYKQGRYEEALGQFRKALILKPDYAPAAKFIKLLQEKKLIKTQDVIPPAFESTFRTPTKENKERLAIEKIEQEIISQRQPAAPEQKSAVAAEAERAYEEAAGPEALEKEQEVRSPAFPMPSAAIRLDSSFAQIPQPVEIPQGSSILISGVNIQRFLTTEANVLTVEKKSGYELVVTAEDIGYTYLHVWDSDQRWTIEFLSTLPQPEGGTYDETLRSEEDRSRSFKLSYDLTWSLAETGRRPSEVNRSSYNWGIRLGLDGETPYGDLNSQTTFRRQNTKTDLTYINLALTDGKLGNLRGFTLQALDYSSPFSNMAFPGAALRGGMFASPVFDGKLEYAVVWGREGGGRYGNLSPSLAKTKNSFINAGNIRFAPDKHQTYKASAVHAWGRDREAELPRYAYAVASDWNFEDWGLGYEAAFDSDRFAYLMKSKYSWPKVDLSTELRNSSRNFHSSTGRGWRAGELGGMVNANYRVTKNLKMDALLDVYKDRFFPAVSEDDRWNETFNWNSVYTLDPTASITLGYNLQNKLGTISIVRTHAQTMSISKVFKTEIREITTFFDYSHQENKSFSTPSASYMNDKINFGFRVPVIGDLSYYYNREHNWLLDRFNSIRTKPYAYETGVDWSGQLWNSPFRSSFRFSFRDEEDTDATLSFLSGIDYISGFAELSYRPDPNTEIYGSGNMRNSWEEKGGAAKSIDFNFNAGMRYLWDTGFTWESVGNIEGTVFKDLNSDGLRQRNEAPMEGVRIWLGKDRSVVTDLFGHYKFTKVKARKAYITLDAATLPQGFVVTVPLSQEVPITHHRSTQIDFGAISRSEISGFVFEDINGDGEYGREDKGVQGVVMMLEDGSRAVTDGTGRYSFPNAAPGAHNVTLQLDSLPVYYLPQTALSTDITLTEGVTYLHNIPLKRTGE